MRQINLKKNSKIRFYLINFLRSLVPRSFNINKKNKLIDKIDENRLSYLNSRVDYYLKHPTPFTLPSDSVILKDYKLKGKSAYFYDLKYPLNYFPLSMRIRYLFGDVTTVEQTATIVKSRPISNNNSNSVIMKLDTVRHFNFINDNINLSDKKNMAVWRGKVFEGKQPHREVFFNQALNLKNCDIGKTNKNGKNTHWEKAPMSITEQLKFKYILCVEGNDVATSLKWVMSSNSLCLMCKPKFETWFMEGTLIANHHYVELKEDYSDLDEKIEYYNTHIEEAQKTINNANDYVKQFQNSKQELLISLLVLQKYFKLSNQG
ncbi:MAG: lipopolysaccharide A protein [Colwellia sp.]|nr:lipopolysaccharide A protein [Colwellia sp.]